MAAELTEYQVWEGSLSDYNERYEKQDQSIKDRSKAALRLLHLKKPTTEVADALVELSTDLHKLVELRGECGYNYRCIKNFYERHLIGRKLDIMADGKEKKIAANVAEGRAVLESRSEFELMSLAETYWEICDGRFKATEELIASLQTKLTYGYKP